MKPILLIGIQGQLGQELPHTLKPVGEIIGVGRKQMDLADGEQIRQVIRQVKPELIVNAAAYTAVDRAETEPELAQAINAIAPTIMAEEAQNLHATLLHISTDYVFDGHKSTPYTEEDATNPLNIYGQSKLAGEEGIRKTGGPYIILRTAWVYGTYGRGNFVKTMLRLGAQRQEVRVVADQVGTPTWTRDIAGAIAGLSKLSLESTSEAITGIYHFTNSGVASWYDLAIAIFEEGRQLGFPLSIERVVPITTPEYPTPAKRPAYSVLSSHKISALLGTYSPHWRHSLRQMLSQFYAQKT
jgi:dTDP-4-dehydrorhamnose reductase